MNKDSLVLFVQRVLPIVQLKAEKLAAKFIPHHVSICDGQGNRIL